MADLTELDMALGGDGTLLDPGEVPSWVHVETVRAVVAVRCERCAEAGRGGWDAFYHCLLVRDPALLGRAVAKHAGCGERQA